MDGAFLWNGTMWKRDFLSGWLIPRIPAVELLLLGIILKAGASSFVIYGLGGITRTSIRLKVGKRGKRLTGAFYWGWHLLREGLECVEKAEGRTAGVVAGQMDASWSRWMWFGSRLYLISIEAYPCLFSSSNMLSSSLSTLLPAHESRNDSTSPLVSCRVLLVRILLWGSHRRHHNVLADGVLFLWLTPSLPIPSTLSNALPFFVFHLCRSIPLSHILLFFFYCVIIATTTTVTTATIPQWTMDRYYFELRCLSFLLFIYFFCLFLVLVCSMACKSWIDLIVLSCCFPCSNFLCRLMAFVMLLLRVCMCVG